MLQLNFVKELPNKVPSKLKVYSTKRVVAGRSLLWQMAIGLKIMKDREAPVEFRSMDNWTIAKHGAYTIAVNSISGAVRFRDEKRHGREFGKKFEISELRLTEIARQFIDDTGFVKQRASELKVAKVSHLYTQGGSVNGKATVKEALDAGVIFVRDIENIPVLGFGGYAMINVAYDGSVVAGSKVWRYHDKALSEEEILQPDFAVDELKKRLTERGLRNKVNILKADFCYFEADENTRQKYLEPTYAFLFAAKTKRFNYKSVEIIPATRQPRQTWIPKKRFSPPA